jgi:hypothetical protein
MSNGRYGRSASSRQPWSTLRDYLDAVAKLVGVSDDFERLAACEPVARIALEDRVSIALAGQRCHCAHGRSANAARNADEIPPTVRNTDETGRAGEDGAELEIADWRGHRLNVSRITAMDANHHNRCFQEVDSVLTIPMPFIPPARLGRRPAAARPPWNGGVMRPTSRRSERSDHLVTA